MGFLFRETTKLTVETGGDRRGQDQFVNSFSGCARHAVSGVEVTMSNRGDLMMAIEELRWELGQLGRRLDRLAAMVDGSPEIGGLYGEQVMAGARARSGEPDPEAG